VHGTKQEKDNTAKATMDAFEKLKALHPDSKKVFYEASLANQFNCSPKTIKRRLERARSLSDKAK
jgi:hypothetical protein